ncbi:MAG: hypothetical protein QM655_12680 [Nocardioidaceae bacterium]
MSELMTARERSDLQQLARMNARVAKSDVDAVVSQRLMELEQEIDKTWTTQELQVDGLVIEANRKIEEINELITKQCDELGIREALRPRMAIGFTPGGRSILNRGQLDDLRKLAKAELDAAGKRAKVEIDRQTARVCGEIVANGLTTQAAGEMLGRVDSPEQLVPVITMMDLEHRKLGGR